jgi:hypothetical protein
MAYQRHEREAKADEARKAGDDGLSSRMTVTRLKLKVMVQINTGFSGPIRGSSSRQLPFGKAMRQTVVKQGLRSSDSRPFS